MKSNPEDAIPLATPETSTTQNKRERVEVQVVAVFLFGVLAVVLLVVASAIYDSNKQKYWDCFDGVFKRGVKTDGGCADRGSYACVAPGLPTKLVWIAPVLALLSAIAGIRWSCSNWCTCCGIRGKISGVGCPPCVIASCFLTLELLAAAYYGLTLFLFLVGSHLVTRPPLSTLGTGRCCCDHTDLGDTRLDSPAIIAGMAAAVTIFGIGHLLASKRAGENQGTSASAAI